ncbi:MAG: DUF3102 domain-containing protein [Bacillota bacterium]|nr:DUF3102 domain-containing protein [Bacillota bacterium]
MNEMINNEGVKPTTRTVNLIAAEINSIKEQTRKMVLYNSIEIGRRLVEAKSMLSHGEWGEWLEKSVDYSKSTANNLMRIFQEYGSEQITLLTDNAKSQALGNLSYTQAIALLGIPSEDRESFVKENDIDSMSTRELQQAIKEKQELEKRLKEAEKRAEDEHKAWEAINSSYSKLEKASKKNSKEAEKLKKELQDIEDKNKEELTNKEVEIQNLQIHIKDIKGQLSLAQSNGSGKEVEVLQESLNEAENKLHDAAEKIQELEQKLNEKPIEVIAATPEVEIIEKIPEEIEKELQELREKASKKDNPAVIKYSVIFNGLVDNFKLLLATLDEIRKADEAAHEKYKNATIKLADKMVAGLK